MTISHCDGDMMDLFETGAKTFPKKLLTPYFQYFSLNTYLYILLVYIYILKKFNKGGVAGGSDSCSAIYNYPFIGGTK